MHWRSITAEADAMRGAADDDDILYATGWTISGLATLGTIVAVWLFGI
jgi:lysyl-tRNA synthetase class I